MRSRSRFRELLSHLFPLVAFLGLVLAARGMLSAPAELRAGQELRDWNLGPVIESTASSGLAQVQP